MNRLFLVFISLFIIVSKGYSGSIVPVSTVGISLVKHGNIVFPFLNSGEVDREAIGHIRFLPYEFPEVSVNLSLYSEIRRYTCVHVDIIEFVKRGKLNGRYLGSAFFLDLKDRYYLYLDRYTYYGNFLFWMKSMFRFQSMVENKYNEDAVDINSGLEIPLLKRLHWFIDYRYSTGKVVSDKPGAFDFSLMSMRSLKPFFLGEHYISHGITLLPMSKLAVTFESLFNIGEESTYQVVRADLALTRRIHLESGYFFCLFRGSLVPYKMSHLNFSTELYYLGMRLNF